MKRGRRILLFLFRKETSGVNKYILRRNIIVMLLLVIVFCIGFISGILFTINYGDISPTEDADIFVFELMGNTWVYDYTK